MILITLLDSIIFSVTILTLKQIWVTEMSF